jgi:hypothetical protein
MLIVFLFVLDVGISFPVIELGLEKLRISEPPEFHEILARSSDCHLPLNLI